MTDFVAFVHNITSEPETGNIIYQVKMRCTGMTDSTPDVTFDVPVPVDALPATVNSTIKDAAVAAIVWSEHGTSGEFDKKTLIGGAVGL